MLKHLSALGHQSIVLDNFSPQVHGDLLAVEHKNRFFLQTRSDIHVGDIRNYETVASLIKQANVVVHFSGRNGVGQSMYECCRYDGHVCINFGQVW